jgi:hypothetical protein
LSHNEFVAIFSDCAAGSDIAAKFVFHAFDHCDYLAGLKRI